MSPEDLQGRVTISVGEAASLLGISRNSAYESTRRYLATGGAEGLPVLRIGRRLVVPIARLRVYLGDGGDG